jgi:predicted nucleotidyltransferase
MVVGSVSKPGEFKQLNHRSCINKNRELIQDLAKRYGIINIRICGSVARGEDSASSDIDILVDMEPGSSLLSLGSFLMDIQDLLGCRVDVLTERGLKKRVRERVLKEAIPL